MYIARLLGLPGAVIQEIHPEHSLPVQWHAILSYYSLFYHVFGVSKIVFMNGEQDRSEIKLLMPYLVSHHRLRDYILLICQRFSNL